MRLLWEGSEVRPACGTQLSPLIRCAGPSPTAPASTRHWVQWGRGGVDGINSVAFEWEH